MPGNVEGTTDTSTPVSAFLKHEIIKIEHSYTFRLLSYFYFSNNAFKNFLVSTASLTPRVISVNTRNSDMWYVPWFRNKYSLQSLQYNLPHILNKYQGVKCSSPKELRILFVIMWRLIVFLVFFNQSHLRMVFSNSSIYLFLFIYYVVIISL